jgi:hypothetical protein
MARKTKIEKIAEANKQIQELEAYKKKLEAEQREEERKRRTSRLCERGGFIESVIPETVKLDKTQFQDFIKRTLLTDYARRELRKLLPLETKEQTERGSEMPQTVPAQSVTGADKPNVQPPKQA